MCLAAWPVLLLLLRIVTASPSKQDEGDGINRCLGSGRTAACLEDMATDLVENALVPDRLQLLPGLELLRTNRSARGMADVANRTLSFDIVKVAEGLAKGADGRSKKRRRLMMALIMTALIAAKASAVATSTSIMVPLALKGITLLAMKALVIGKIAVVVASAFGFLRLISGSTEHTTEVIYDQKPHHHKRVDHRDPYIPPGYTLLREKPTTGSGLGHHFSQPTGEESQPHHHFRLPPPSGSSQTMPPPLLLRRPPPTSVGRDRRR